MMFPKHIMEKKAQSNLNVKELVLYLVSKTLIYDVS